MIDRQAWQRAGKELGMSDKRGEGMNRALAAVAALAAGYGARKLVTFGWTKITGREPPNDPHDPKVRLGEALTWAVLLGVAMEAARLLAGRAASKNMRRDDSGAQ